jgi:hypothetical protein
MTFKSSAVIVVSLGSWCVGNALFAHHPVGASYDASNPITLQGVAAKVIFASPHCYLWLDVRDSAGDVAHWVVELDDEQKVGAAGLTRRTIAPGMILAVTTFAAKPGTNLIDAIPSAPPEVHGAARAGHLVHGVELQLPDGGTIAVGDK